MNLRIEKPAYSIVDKCWLIHGDILVHHVSKQCVSWIRIQLFFWSFAKVVAIALAEIVKNDAVSATNDKSENSI